MLHITSFMQRVSKRNRQQQINSAAHNLNKFNFDLDIDADDSDDTATSASFSKGYWGYLRDKRADKQKKNKYTLSASLSSSFSLNNINNLSNKNVCANTRSDSVHDEYDKYYYWGLFRDQHLDSLQSDRGEECSAKSGCTKTHQSNRSSVENLSSSCSNSNEHLHANYASSLSIVNKENKQAKKLVYDYKRSKFKIEAQKRDETKLFIQNLEDQESTFKKEIIKPFDTFNTKPSASLQSNRTTSKHQEQLSSAPNTLKKDLLSLTKLTLASLKNSVSSSSSSSSNQGTKGQQQTILSFLFLANKRNDLNEENRAKDFMRIFSTISKLNKSINIFNGNLSSLCSTLTEFNSFLNVHVSINDLNALVLNSHNINNSNNTKSSINNSSKFKPSTISLCSNLYENLSSFSASNMIPFGSQNHLTMLYEQNGIKLGFVALYDKKFALNLRSKLNAANRHKLEYADFVHEGARLAKQLRSSGGAQFVIALVNMECEESEQRLLEQSHDIDLVLSACNEHDPSGEALRNYAHQKWLVKCSNALDSLFLLRVKLDEHKKLSDVSLTKYLVE